MIRPIKVSLYGGKGERNPNFLGTAAVATAATVATAAAPKLGVFIVGGRPSAVYAAAGLTLTVHGVWTAR